MHSKILAIAAGLSLLGAAASADAMPAGPALGTHAVADVTLAAAGCGPGFAPGPAGVCRRIGRGPAAVVVVPRRPVVVRRPGCGVRVGPIGVRTPC